MDQATRVRAASRVLAGFTLLWMMLSGCGGSGGSRGPAAPGVPPVVTPAGPGTGGGSGTGVGSGTYTGIARVTYQGRPQTGVTVTLTTANGIAANVKTDANGEARFPGLTTGAAYCYGAQFNPNPQASQLVSLNVCVAGANSNGNAPVLLSG